jgi:glycosyltransferase involved in cell wall biosynthesis
MIVLLPVYRPGTHLPALVTALRDTGRDLPVVIVDDGSGPAGTALFDTARDLGCTVLAHPTNRGKGAALKTGFRHVAEAHHGHDVVCADADGQHHALDILRVADHTATTHRMALGVRRFEGNVPLRSRFGNIAARWMFRAATGRTLRDTQTGLRAYPHGWLGWLQEVPGERFEYEMNVLLFAARAGRPIDEVDITTTYLDDNRGSHFGSLSDSTQVVRSVLRFMARGRRAHT